MGRSAIGEKTSFFIVMVGAKNRVGRDMGNAHNNTGALIAIITKGLLT